MANPAPGYASKPEHRVDLLPETRRVRVTLAGTVIADSSAALRVEEKCIASFARLELLDLIGGHGVQQTRAVLAGDDDFATGGEVQPSGRGAESVVADWRNDGRIWESSFHTSATDRQECLSYS